MTACRTHELAALLLLLPGAAGSLGAQQHAIPLPLGPGAAIVQTLGFAGGDRESVHRVLDADAEGLVYEWDLVEVQANGDTARQQFRYREGSADVVDARRLWAFHGTEQHEGAAQPETHPGYTMHALSRALYRRLAAGQADSFQVMTVEASGAQLALGDFGRARETPVRWRGTIAPANPGTVPFPLLVNGRRVQVPALRLRGDLTTRHGRWTPEVWILADSVYPLLLKWVGAFSQPENVLQTTRVDLPAAGLAGHGSVLDAALERELDSACRAELPGIYFAFNSAALDPASDRAIASIAAILARHPDWNATLEGHTDSIGTGAANQALSERRVEAVRARLIEQHKASAARLRVVGHGATRPRESNGTIEGRARNRRVELVRDCAAGKGS